MSNNTSLVIGGTGFLGRNLVATLVARGDSVRVIARRARAAHTFLEAENLEFVAADYGDLPQLRDALDGVRTVYHLASSTQPKTSNDNMSFDIESNLIPSMRLAAEIARRGGARLVFVSSGGTVYGAPLATPIAEDHPTDPLCSYGIVKVAVEKYLHLFEDLHGLDYRVLRVSNPYGPGQHLNPAQGVVGNFIHQLCEGKTLHIWGDGSVVRDYVYIDDVTRALLAASMHDGPGRVFNIGSGEGRSLIDVIETISSVLGRRPAIEFTPSRSFDIPINVLNIQMAKAELGWRPDTTFEVGVRRTVTLLSHAQ